MAIDQDALQTAIEAARENSYGTDEASELGARRARAMNYYLGANVNPAPEGRSQVVDKSVYETIGVIKPSLVRIFASSTEEVCKFLPVGPEDEQAAEQTTSVVNHIATQQNQWEQIVSDWIHDAMLMCNGYAMAYWDESKTQLRESYEGQSDDQLAALLSDKSVQVVQHSQYEDKQANAEAQQAYAQAMQQFQAQLPQMQQAYQQAAQAAQQRGMPPPPPPQPPPPPPPVSLHDVVIERVKNEGKVCIKVLPPEHCLVSMDTPDWTLNECPYFEVRQQKTIADLRAMGLEVADDVSDDDEDTDEDDARNRFYEDPDAEGAGVMRNVWCRMIWIRADAEGDGVSRLYYVISVGKTILFAEPTVRIPVSSMTPEPIPHRHFGMSTAETVMDIQDIRTAVTRGGLDNLYLANNGRHAISSRVNVEDFLDARPGGVVRMVDDSSPGDGHIVPLTHPVMFDQVIGSLEYFDQVRQNRTGASRYFSGTDANAINKTASGTMALQNMASMRVEHIARMMAPAVETLFSIVHEIISKHQNKALTLKLEGKWVTVDPQAWRTRRDVKISVGVGAGNKDSMIAQLGSIYAAQMQLMPVGLAGPNQLHATVTEMAKLAGFANPAKFWTDPTNNPPPPPPPTDAQVKAQTEMQKLQFTAQQDQQKMQAETVLEQQRMQMQMEQDRNRQEMEARQKQLELQQQAELASIEAQLKAQQSEMEMRYKTQMERERLEFERWKAELDAVVKLAVADKGDQEEARAANDSGAQMGQIARLLTAPTRVVRDAGGKIVGVEKAGSLRPLVRDEMDRPAGLG